MNTHPYTDEMQLFPGKYLIGPIIKTECMIDKCFSIRLAVTCSSEILIQDFSWKYILNNTYLELNNTKELIKLIISKCNACDEVLNDMFITSGSNVFCLACYDTIFRCARCDCQLGHDFFTIDQKLICSKCSENYFV